MPRMTSAQIVKGNKSNRIAQITGLYTRVDNLEAQALVSGKVTVSVAQANASSVTVNSGLGTITGYMVQHISSSGSQLPDLYVTNSSGSLILKARSLGVLMGSAGSLLPNDTITYICY